MTPPSAPILPRTFEAGDALRAVAAVSVVVYHAAFITNLDYRGSYGRLAGNILQNLDLGLYLFFVLSGYLIARPYVRAYVLNRAAPALGVYARNRFLRIVPAFWVIAALLILRHRLLPDGLPPGTFNSSPGHVAAIFLFVQRFWPSPDSALVGQAWTLNVEVGFYILLPVVALAIGLALRPVPGQSRWWVMVLVAVVVAAMSLAARYLLPATQAWQRSLPAMLFAFMPGVLLAAVELRLAPRSPGARRPWLAPLLLGLGGAILLVAYHRVSPYALGFDSDAPRYQALLAAAGCGLLVAAPLVWQWAGRRPWRVLDNRVSRWIGARSYSLYIVHQGLAFDVAWLLRDSSRGPWVQFLSMVLILLPASLVAAAISYRFVERPFLRLKGQRPAATRP
jgi:peptidoglycan/LPS O-acetylase OafA/YrhL